MTIIKPKLSRFSSKRGTFLLFANVSAHQQWLTASRYAFCHHGLDISHELPSPGGCFSGRAQFRHRWWSICRTSMCYYIELARSMLFARNGGDYWNLKGFTFAFSLSIESKWPGQRQLPMIKSMPVKASGCVGKCCISIAHTWRTISFRHGWQNYMGRHLWKLHTISAYKNYCL